MARYATFSPDHEHLFNHSTANYSSSNGSLTTRSMTDSATLQQFRERTNHLLNSENEKNQLIEDMLYRLADTEKLLERTRLDHDRETHYNREGQMREVQLQDQLRKVKALMDRHPFIVVLLDGDGMIFNDELVAKGEQGGKEAASYLWAAVTDFVSNMLPHLSSPKIITRIYANVKGLGDVFYKSGIIERPSMFEEFTRGFNGSKLLFDFVDVGSGKDRADDKITEIFKLYVYDCHCHQIVFGCSHDNGYARLLEDTMGDKQVLDHITLLEGVPFERELATLKNSFKTTKFENIFRGTKLAINHQTWAMPHPPQPTPAVSQPLAQRALQTVSANLPIGSSLGRVPSNDTSHSTTPTSTWATMTAAPFIPSPATFSSIAKAAPARSPESPAPVLPSVPGIDRNRLGQRVDKLDPTIPNEDIKRVKKLKLCNVFYLQASDACTNLKCNHDHDYKLSRNDRKTLEMVARMTPCFYKTECDDPTCIYGHRCPQSKPGEKDCWYRDNCRFAGWGHGIDTRVVKTTKV